MDTSPKGFIALTVVKIRLFFFGPGVPRGFRRFNVQIERATPSIRRHFCSRYAISITGNYAIANASCLGDDVTWLEVSRAVARQKGPPLRFGGFREPKDSSGGGRRFAAIRSSRPSRLDLSLLASPADLSPGRTCRPLVLDHRGIGKTKHD
jgi:hypothetical protein